jgi:hypothetical protein
VYVVDNTLTNGKVTTGPLTNTDDNGDGADKEQRAKWVVIEGNRINSMIIVKHGSEHIMLRDNVINVDTRMAIEVDGYGARWDRSTEDVYILNNTVTHTGDEGNFLKVWRDAGGLTVSGNLYFAPNMEMGSHKTAVVKVSDNDLDSFREVSGNVWPGSDDGQGANCTMFFVGTDLSTGEDLTPAEWLADAEIAGDLFQNVTLGDRYCVTIGGVTAGSSLRRAA